MPRIRSAGAPVNIASLVSSVTGRGGEASVASSVDDTRPGTAPPPVLATPNPAAGSVVVRVSRETVARGVGGVFAFMRRATPALEPPAPEVQLAARDAQLGAVELFGSFPPGNYVLTVRRQLIEIEGRQPPTTDVRSANVTITTDSEARFVYTGDALTSDVPSTPSSLPVVAVPHDASARHDARFRSLASAGASADFITLHYDTLNR